MFTEKNICLIIPTYNRSEDVDITMSALIKNKNIPGKIIIVDQSKDDKTKKILNKYKKKLPLKYIYSSTPSSSIAESLGVNDAKKNFSLILISGDDVTFLPGYMKTLADEFDKNSRIMGIGGIDIKSGAAKHTSKSTFANFLLKLFFLPFSEDHQFRVRGPYGFTASPVINRSINNAEWIPGFNNCFRSEVYKTYDFPKIRGYNVLEDIDCSYTIFKKYGSGSLMITPNCKVLHRESKTARYPERKRIFVNHEDHFAFYYRHFYTLLGTLKLSWSLLGIIIGNFLRASIKPSKESFLNLKNNIDGIFYAYKNRDKIKRGEFRSFLNDDLSMKSEYA